MAATQPVSISNALATLVPEPGLVVLMCGLAGSGKTTFSQKLEARGFARLSIDELVWSSAGRYGLDYPPEAYAANLTAARQTLKVELTRRLREGCAVVVDSAFWSRAHRDAFVALIADEGGRHRIVYLNAPKDVLRARLAARRSRFDANAAFPVDGATLERFADRFEPPAPEENPLLVRG